MPEWLKALIWIMPPIGAAALILLVWRLDVSLDKITKPLTTTPTQGKEMKDASILF